MCEPVSIGMIAVAGATAGLQIAAQEKAEDASFAYQRSMHEATERQIQDNNALVLDSYISKISQEQTAQQQERQAIAEQNFDKAREVRLAKSAALTAGAEAGVGGVSLNNILQNFSAQEAFYNSRLEANQQFQEGQRKIRLGA